MKSRIAMLLILAFSFSFLSASEKPNIIFIMADDLGYSDLGCYGQQLIETPNIDRLATEGMRFTQFYAGASVCAPSRSVIQTGLHTGHTTVRGNQCRAGGLRQPPGTSGRPGSMRIGIPATDTTIGALLQKAGYYTGLIGKWHLSGYKYDNLPVFRGYDEFLGSSLADRGSSWRDWMFYNDSVIKISEKFNADSRDGIWTNIAIDFINRHRDESFMLMVNYSTPHKPFNIADQGIYKDKPWNDMTKNYAALISRLDQHVGMILDALKEEGLEDNTILLFCSDNGGEYREYPDDWSSWTKTIQSNKPLRGGKADIYEGGIRIPMIVRWPGKTERGSISKQPLYFPDIMPTFLDIAGATPPAWCDGISMVDILTGKKEKLDDRFMYWEFEHRGFHQAVRWNEWVMLRYSIKKKRIYGQAEMDDQRRSEKYPLFELYNLNNDLTQENNVIEEYPLIAFEILNYMKSARSDSDYYPLRPEEQESLNALNETTFK